MHEYVLEAALRIFCSGRDAQEWRPLHNPFTEIPPMRFRCIHKEGSREGDVLY